MNEESIIRLAISLDDQAPTTIDKYICRLVEQILYDASQNSLTLAEVCKLIESSYGLQFDAFEIENSIKGKSKGSVYVSKGTYSLSPKKLDTIKKRGDIGFKLRNYINEYRNSVDSSINPDEFYNCVTKYLYFSFNSSKSNLLSLLDEHRGIIPSFPASNTEIKQINDFINWENPEKNKFLYSVISFSYEYCMLTTRSDTLLSRKIFAGKKFILDANIIFRMAGINNSERKLTIGNFAKKCNDVGIELYYTSETLAELQRVIVNQIRYVIGITQGQEPIHVSVLNELYGNDFFGDFYQIYYSWCRQTYNKYNDFVSFQQYLIGLIQDVISELKFLDISGLNGKINKQNFSADCESLKDYKTSRKPDRNVSKESVNTDIKNVLYTISIRKKSSNPTFWQTNEYMVTADQLLISWANEVYPGIPIVVLPSVWLSLILRFTGRSDDDYKSFCALLSVRQFNEDEDLHIDSERLLRVLSKKTDDKSIKEKVILEIVRNKDQYALSNAADYENSAELAFNKMLDDLRAESGTEINNLRFEMSERLQAVESQKQEELLKERQKKEEIFTKLAENKAEKMVEKYRKLLPLTPYIKFVALGLGGFAALSFAYGIGPIHEVIVSLFPSTFDSTALQWDFYKTLCAFAAAALFTGSEIIKDRGSEDRRKKLYTKFYHENSKSIDSVDPKE